MIFSKTIAPFASATRFSSQRTRRRAPWVRKDVKMAARKSGFFVGAVAGAGVACAALAGVGMRMGPAGAAEPAQVVRTSGAGAPAPMFAPPPGAPMSFADIFEKVSPAVVQINVTSKASPQGLRIPGLEGFDIVPRGQKGKPGQDGEDGDSPATPKQQSAGSGFFISADGYIVTNNHVVADADDIQVVMKDGRELKATLVGRDEGTDLAVVKVIDPKAKGADFPYVNFENQAKPRVGDWVITIGNPFGLGGTATAGIISAITRHFTGALIVDEAGKFFSRLLSDRCPAHLAAAAELMTTLATSATSRRARPFPVPSRASPVRGGSAGGPGPCGSCRARRISWPSTCPAGSSVTPGDHWASAP